MTRTTANWGDILHNLASHGVNDPRMRESIVEMLSSSDHEQQRMAALAAGELGTTAKETLPSLRRILQVHDLNEQTRRDVEWALHNIEIGGGKRTSPAVEIEHSIATVSPSVPPAPKRMTIPAYFDLLKETNPQERSEIVRDSRVLPNGQSMMPSEDVPFLIKVMDGRDADLAERAGAYLYWMAIEFATAGKSIRDIIAAALPAMVAHFDDPNPSVQPLDFGNRHRWRLMVIRFVATTRTEPDRHLLARIVSAVDDESTDVGIAAASVLANLKTITPEVLAMLLARMDDPSPEMRRAVMEGLAANKNGDPRFINGLAANLDNPVMDHQAAARALSDLGSIAKAAEPAVRRFLSKNATENTPEGIAQSYARIALGKMSVK